MSDLFSVKILEVDGYDVKCHVDVVHPDQNSIPCEKNIALQILMEHYSNCRNGYIYESGFQKYSFTEEDGLEMAETHPMKDSFEELLTLSYGEEVTITEEEYKELEKNWPPEISSMGMSEGVFSKTYHPKYPEFCEKADLLIESVSLASEENNPRPDDDMEGKFDPKADFNFTVKDKKLLYHMRADCFWGSAMFDFTIY